MRRAGISETIQPRKRLARVGYCLGKIGLYASRALIRPPRHRAETCGSGPRDTLRAAWLRAGTLRHAHAFDAAGGATYTGEKVPVEDTGGQGTADSHWRESVFGSEIMTGFIGAGSNPLSAVTVRSLEDQGYGVNPAAADPFTILSSLRAGQAAAGFRLHRDVLPGPIYRVDESGRITGVVRR